MVDVGGMPSVFEVFCGTRPPSLVGLVGSNTARPISFIAIMESRVCPLWILPLGREFPGVNVLLSGLELAGRLSGGQGLILSYFPLIGLLCRHQGTYWTGKLLPLEHHHLDTNQYLGHLQNESAVSAATQISTEPPRIRGVSRPPRARLLPSITRRATLPSCSLSRAPVKMQRALFCFR